MLGVPNRKGPLQPNAAAAYMPKASNPKQKTSTKQIIERTSSSKKQL